MAKRRYRRYRRRRGRWSSNIQSLRLSGVAESEDFGDSYTIAQNPVQSNTTVSQQYTVKNIEITGQIESNAQANYNVENIQYYIIYVPEGYPISLDLPYSHPEWIMAYKYIGQSALTTVTSNYYQPPRIKTRLSRRLNTGDSIIFMYRGTNTTGGNVPIRFNGLVRWWTKAN